jgi:hypothetical protein
VTSPSSLALAIHARNARLRAWAQTGVPVSGGWVLVQRPPEVWVDTETGEAKESRPPPDTLLLLQCGACGAERAERYHGSLVAEDLPVVEQSFLRDLRVDNGCTHLAPLLLPDPEAVVALTALEMLSTG